MRILITFLLFFANSATSLDIEGKWFSAITKTENNHLYQVKLYSAYGTLYDIGDNEKKVQKSQILTGIYQKVTVKKNCKNDCVINSFTCILKGVKRKSKVSMQCNKPNDLGVKGRELFLNGNVESNNILKLKITEFKIGTSKKKEFSLNLQKT